jgi:3-oxoacyl-[acyl-carrier-protein] synthase-3
LYIEPPTWGTDGRGASNLIVPDGGARSLFKSAQPQNGHAPRLHMNGAEVFNFTAERVPELVEDVLRKHGQSIEDIDLFVFHQASRMLLDHLRRKLRIPPEKFCIALDDCGNTVSSTIPIALHRAFATGLLRPGNSVLLAGFGVGYSWAGTIIRWPNLTPSDREGAPQGVTRRDEVHS